MSADELAANRLMFIHRLVQHISMLMFVQLRLMGNARVLQIFDQKQKALTHSSCDLMMAPEDHRGITAQPEETTKV